ncbi:hypothetical protein [Saccharothrix deserti]|uniref:hypothetical protein n=1 Tax=Saccharothrix deserti TaxID=2593674 RepID=UPI00131EB10E|nr:hypothetical protein [Saccharothrix deserti]
MSPDHDNTISKICPICWERFTATGRQAKHKAYCSPSCKRTAAARREVERTSHPAHPSTPAAAPAPTAPLPQTVAQRDCPHCGGPVTIVALLTTPEAARPQMPIAAPDGVVPLRR